VPASALLLVSVESKHRTKMCSGLMDPNQTTIAGQWAMAVIGPDEDILDPITEVIIFKSTRWMI